MLAEFSQSYNGFKSLHGLSPEYLRETACNLMDSENKLNVPLPDTNYYKNSFSYGGAILYWNSFLNNCDLREAESLKQFN